MHAQEGRPVAEQLDNALGHWALPPGAIVAVRLLLLLDVGLRIRGPLWPL